ncbi:hypothetical protein R6Z07M_005508 [Ovis aries]
MGPPRRQPAANWGACRRRDPGPASDLDWDRPSDPGRGDPGAHPFRRALGPCSDPDPCLPDPPQTDSRTPSHVDPAAAPLPTRRGPQAPDLEPPARPWPRLEEAHEAAQPPGPCGPARRGIAPAPAARPGRRCAGSTTDPKRPQPGPGRRPAGGASTGPLGTARGTLRPPSLGTAGCPLRCTRSPALRLPPHWTPRPSRSPAGRVGTSRRGLLRVRTVPWGKPAATRDPKPCPRASSSAPRRALASQGGGRRSSRHSAAGLGCGRTRDRRSAPGPQAGPERARARSAARNHGSRRLGAQPPSALRPLLRCQGGGGGPGPGLTGRRARSRRLMSPREAVPPAPRDRAGGETPGRRARGGAHAGLRGEARGPGGESAARAARPARARRPGEEGARRRGSRGGAAPGPCPQRARPGAPGGLVGIPGTAEALISPRNWGARERCTAAPPGRSPPGCGAVGASLPPPIPSSPGPPDPLPRPDPAAKGWAGKRALWDRCQLRDKRHKIGGNGGSAAGALGRGRRRRGGRILGDDRGKFGKSPRRLRGGGGHAGRAALRAALALSAPLLNNSWRGRRPLACTGRAARLCPVAAAAAAAAFGAPAALDERPRGGRARAVPALTRRSAGRPAPIVPRACAPGRPVTARAPQRARRPGAGSLGPRRSPARPGMHVNLEKVAGRAGADLRGRAWAPPAPRAFVFAPDKGPSRRRSRTWRPCPAGHSAGWSDRSTRGSRSEKRTSGAVGGAVRDPGSGAWPCASPAPSRSCPALGRVVGDGTALLSAPVAA